MGITDTSGSPVFVLYLYFWAARCGRYLLAMLSMWVSTGTEPGWSRDMRRMQSATLNSWFYRKQEEIKL